jgi:hypothetical protein
MNPLQKAAGSLVSSLKIGVSSFKSIGSIGLTYRRSAISILAQTATEGNSTIDYSLTLRTTPVEVTGKLLSSEKPAGCQPEDVWGHTCSCWSTTIESCIIGDKEIKRG